jgi:succinate-semialdehyde dehydrogenase
MKSKLTGLAAGTVSGNPSAGELIKTYPHQTPDESTTIGPIARGDFRDGVHDQVVRSIASGTELLLGGNKIDGPGYFYEPTALADVRPGMAAAFAEEVFGRVAAITVAKDVEDAITLANTSEFGLSGDLWTNDITQATEVPRRLETGGVFINGYPATRPFPSWLRARMGLANR